MQLHSLDFSLTVVIIGGVFFSNAYAYTFTAPTSKDTKLALSPVS